MNLYMIRTWAINKTTPITTKCSIKYMTCGPSQSTMSGASSKNTWLNRRKHSMWTICARVKMKRRQILCMLAVSRILMRWRIIKISLLINWRKNQAFLKCQYSKWCIRYKMRILKLSTKIWMEFMTKATENYKMTKKLKIN